MKSIFALIACCTSLLAANPLGEETGNCEWLHDYLITIPDFPQPGVQFKWYPKLLQEPSALRRAIETYAKRYKDAGLDAIVGLDSRGFIFGTALAYEMKLPLVLIRKAGKLPCKAEKIEYSLEYGKNAFEIEIGSIQRGEKVLVIDDVLATGGTAKAACELVERLGGSVVEFACLIELPFLQGRAKIERPVYSMLSLGGK